LQPKLNLTRGQRNTEFVSKGEVEIAIQLSNEIRIVPGIAFIPLPAELARTFVFSAALPQHTKEMVAAKAVLQFPAGPEGITAVRAKGWIKLSQNRGLGSVRTLGRVRTIADVRLGSKATVPRCFRFSPNRRHSSQGSACLKRAKSRQRTLGLK
jgi:hypothetical protein